MVEPLELGRFISTCRKEKNLTQKQLGEELGVTDRAVFKMGEWKIIPGHQSDRATVSDTGYQCR